MQERKLRNLLDRLGALSRTEQRHAGVGDGLQPVHQDVLRYLSRCNRYSNTPAAVTEYLQVTKGTASQSIQLLSRRGLVLKHADPEDGRVIRLRLSAAGRRLAARLGQLVNWEKVLDSIDAAELVAAEAVLTRILRELQQQNGYRTFGQCQTCDHFQRGGEQNFCCGLTGEPLEAEEILQICREHTVNY